MKKKTKEEREATLIDIIFILIFMVFLIGLIRLFVINPDVLRSDVCKDVYGENWRYELTHNFGRTCVELDYVTLGVTNRTSYNWTNEEIYNKYCNPPKYLDLKRWNNGCII